jgi:hypothetical protein
MPRLQRFIEPEATVANWAGPGTRSLNVTLRPAIKELGWKTCETKDRKLTEKCESSSLNRAQVGLPVWPTAIPIP